jgi:hypothetical protein
MHVLRPIVLLTLCCLVGGCVRLPIGSDRRALSPAANGLSTVTIGQTTREDLTQRFGPLSGYFPDLHTGYYVLDDVDRHHLWLFLCIIPVGTSTSSESEAALVQFDSDDRVQQMKVKSMIHATPEIWHIVAEDWSSTNHVR